MGIFDLMKKKISSVAGDVFNTITECTKSSEQSDDSSTESYHPKAFQGTMFERDVVLFHERKESTFPSKNGLYVAEILLLEYCSYGNYPNSKSEYPGFWFWTYGISDVDEILKSLEERGFIRMGTAKENLHQLKVADLKKILASYELSTAGKKDALISRIAENCDESALLNQISDFKYVLTDLGREELSENEYVPYMHKHHFSDISVFDMNVLVNEHPKLKYRDLLWSEFNRLSLEHIKKKRNGLYRNTRHDMCRFLIEEERYDNAFMHLAEVFYYDLNGDRRPFIANGLLNTLRDLTIKTQYSEEKMIEVLKGYFDGIYTPYHNFTTEEAVCIIVAYAFGQNEIAESVFNSKTKVID